MRKCAILAVMAAYCVTAQAGSLDIRQVSADAKWLVHLDVDAMRQSSLMEKAYLAGTQQRSEWQSWLATACDEVSVDPKFDLHAITVFGERASKLEGVAIISAEIHPNLMISRAKQESGYNLSTYGDHDIHSWTDGRETVIGCFYTPSLLVVARTEEEVQDALDVLRGKAPALSTRLSAVIGTLPERSMLVAWGEGVAELPLPFQLAAVKKSESVRIIVAEKQNEVFASIRLAMQTTDAAQKMISLLEGLRSAAELQYEGNVGMLNILRAVKLSASEKTVLAELRTPATELWAQINRVLALVKPHNP